MPGCPTSASSATPHSSPTSISKTALPLTTWHHPHPTRTCASRSAHGNSIQFLHFSRSEVNLQTRPPRLFNHVQIVRERSQPLGARGRHHDVFLILQRVTGLGERHL